MDQLHTKLLNNSSWYSFWHKQKGHQLFHWVFFALIALLFVLLLTGEIKKPGSLKGLFSSAYRMDPPLDGPFVPTPPRPTLRMPPSTPATFPTTDKEFVTELYSCILGRQPDDWGFNTWLKAFRSGSAATHLYHGFFDSLEYQQKNVSNQEFLVHLYNCILFRTPNRIGYGDWLIALQDESRTRAEVLDPGVLGSTEFLNNISPKLEALRPIQPQTFSWQMQVLALDGINRSQKVDIPVAEAVSFIEKRSRFKFSYAVTESSEPHGYTRYDCGEGPQKCVVVNYFDVNPSIVDALPVADSYLLLWNSNSNPPLQAGSTWGATEGILKQGTKRPYATIPVDPWWYNNDPHQGFSSRAASIVTHELINVINSKLESAPYYCVPLTGTPGSPADKYESDRLAKLTDDCYARLQAQ